MPQILVGQKLSKAVIVKLALVQKKYRPVQLLLSKFYLHLSTFSTKSHFQTVHVTFQKIKSLGVLQTGTCH
jgi:hypothetical protein